MTAEPNALTAAELAELQKPEYQTRNPADRRGFFHRENWYSFGQLLATIADLQAQIATLREGQRTPGTVAWVIEVSNGGPPVYFDGRHFSGDHLKAIRFARQEDAQRFATMRCQDSNLPWRVVEHAWDLKPTHQPPSVQATAEGSGG